MQRKERPSSARRAESRVGRWKESFAATVPKLTPESTMSALKSIDLYLELAVPCRRSSALGRLTRPDGSYSRRSDSRPRSEVPAPSRQTRRSPRGPARELPGLARRGSTGRGCGGHRHGG